MQSLSVVGLGGVVWIFIHKGRMKTLNNRVEKAKIEGGGALNCYLSLSPLQILVIRLRYKDPGPCTDGWDQSGVEMHRRNTTFPSTNRLNYIKPVNAIIRG